MLVIAPEVYREWRSSAVATLLHQPDIPAASIDSMGHLIEQTLQELDRHLVEGSVVEEAQCNRHDVSTQVCTVSGVSFTAQFMRRHRAERAAAKLSRDLGRLAALSTELCKDIGVLLDLAVLGAVAKSMPPATADESAAVGEAADAATDHPATPPPHLRTPQQHSDDMLSLLSPSTVEAVCCTSKAFRRLASATTHPPNEPVEARGHTDSTSQRQRAAVAFLRERLIQRFRLAVQHVHEQQQQAQGVRADFLSGGHPAFLCWRCRQDGRQDFSYNTEQRQLSKTAKYPFRSRHQNHM